MLHILAAALCVVALSGCSSPSADSSSGATDIASLPPLAPPASTRAAPDELEPALRPAMADTFVLDMACNEVATWAGIDLLYLEASPAGTGRVVCAVSGGPTSQMPVHDQASLPESARTGWGIHVLYVPSGVDLTATSYVDLIAAGGTDVAQYAYWPAPDPAPRQDNPSEPAGGYTSFERNGERGTIQRNSDRAYTATWSVRTGVGLTRVFLASGALAPDELVAAARRVRNGVPPGATVAEEARGR